ncbi:MAG: ACP S-malonyltransferase [Candidatus Competibacterales bacterium]
MSHHPADSTAEGVAFLFPGQGAQYPGMGSDLCKAHPVAQRRYDTASELLGYDLLALCTEDRDGVLNQTRYTQPALLTHGLACLEVFNELTDGQVRPALAAGHSLGEYAALVATGVLNFEVALGLVQVRGELMATHGEGEMAAFPLDEAQLAPLAQAHYCAVAACNLPGQTVAGGAAADLDALTQTVVERDAKTARRVVRLKTEGAFHTYYMVEAAKRFRPVLARVTFDPPSHGRPLSNFSGDFHSREAADLRAQLFYQLFHPVRWLDNLRVIAREPIGVAVEFGGGLGSGADPATKRPNLESMFKKAMAHFERRDIQYLPAINEASLAAAGRFFA